MHTFILTNSYLMMIRRCNYYFGRFQYEKSYSPRKTPITPKSPPSSHHHNYVIEYQLYLGLLHNYYFNLLDIDIVQTLELYMNKSGFKAIEQETILPK